MTDPEFPAIRAQRKPSSAHSAGHLVEGLAVERVLKIERVTGCCSPPLLRRAARRFGFHLVHQMLLPLLVDCPVADWNPVAEIAERNDAGLEESALALASGSAASGGEMAEPEHANHDAVFGHGRQVLRQSFELGSLDGVVLKRSKGNERRKRTDVDVLNRESASFVLASFHWVESLYFDTDDMGLVHRVGLAKLESRASCDPDGRQIALGETVELGHDDGQERLRQSLSLE